MADGTYPYKNIFQTIFKTVSQEGVTKLWVGFPTFYFRIAPHVLFTWLFMGMFNNMFDSIGKKWLNELRY